MLAAVSVVAAVALVSAACGDDDDATPTPTTTTSTSTSTATASKTETGTATTTATASKTATGTGTATTGATENAITIKAIEMQYDVSGPLKPGVATITFTNAGTTAHMMATFRMKDGVTLDQVKEAFTSNDENAVTPLMADGPDDSVYGTPGALSGGESTTVTAVDLKPGNYAIACFFVTSDGTPHFAMGMVGEFTVTGDAVTTEPTSDGTITLTDDAFTFPDQFDGSGTWKVTNTGTATHSLSIAKLDAGTTVQDYRGYVGGQLANNQPIDGGGGTLVAGVDDLLPGQTAYLTTDLKAGHYGYVSTEETDDIAGEFDIS